MTIMEAINKEIEGLVDYLLMLGEMAGNPADFVTERNGKRYALMLREIPEEPGPEPEQEPEHSEE